MPVDQYRLPAIDPRLRELSAFLKGEELAEAIRKMPASRAEALLYNWQLWARSEQVAPRGAWVGWLISTGRGWGKTRTGTEFVRDYIEHGIAGRVGLISRTAADSRDVLVEGPSGIIAVCPPWNRPTFEPTKRRVQWSSGAMATIYSADEPDQLRGVTHDFLLMDEVASWRLREAWDNSMLGLRLGPHPRWIACTTPKTTPLYLELLALARPPVLRDGIYYSESPFVLTRGSVYDNRANLPASFFEFIISKYEGTRLGAQELLGELLKDDPAALWQRDTMIHKYRVVPSQVPVMKRIVVGIDPAGTSSATSNETGIVVAGVGTDEHGYVLGDFSGRYTPLEWAKKAIDCFHSFKANVIVAETQMGADLVVANLLTVDKTIPVKRITASRGKILRAEPISALYQQGLIHHVGHFSELEDQQCTFVGHDAQSSPDRLDALVHALSELLIDLKRLVYGKDYAIL